MVLKVVLLSFINDLLKPTPNLSTLSKYTVLNGIIYLGVGSRHTAPGRFT